MNHLKLFESFSEIHDICKKYNIYNYKINSEGLVDVDEDVNLSSHFDRSVNLGNRGLTKLPLKFGRVTGSFYCNRNQLNSLVGAPQTVGGSFFCSDNQLTSLVGAPQTVGGSFFCRDNNLTSLEGSPREVGGDFDCARNQITSLERAPNIGAYFSCRGNPIYEIYRLFTSYSDFISSMDYNYLRGTDIIKSRFEEMCLEYGIKVPERIEGYNYI